MRIQPFGARVVFSLAAALSLLAAGCAKEENKTDPGKGTAVAEKEKAGDHSGWWCDEHGVPEEICGQCSAKAAADCKKKGDWCEEHDRPDSQCFIHHPELKEKFAAQYRTKYGKEPPPMEEEPTKEESKKEAPTKEKPKS